MEFTKPVKLPDGRYFLKINGARRQVNDVLLQDDLVGKSVNFKVETGLDVFQTIDEEILAHAKQSKVEWFGKELSDETINGAYQESITDGVLSSSLATIKGEIVTLAFDRQKNPVALQDIKADTRCDVMFELAGLWFLKKSFGPIWRVIQVRVRGAPKAPDFPKDYLFTDDPEEVEDDPADYVD
ncbi:hypothetical protein AR679_gp118 [Yellowstone lake phycodnavirus 1]|uniref:hypothetical protein n=1 Tax=Yellowstone lake phycodnavirus 1 TaxID=1586713 RepID=UPI0006EB4E98|nr:hypothetical protein AR679_gp118 [Yellowstone lake phycodnavirus 1]BAT22144.1 hypothetical protein [Yellowstone lake phycodnavirus 1]